MFVLIPFEENPGFSINGKLEIENDVLLCNLRINPLPQSISPSPRAERSGVEGSPTKYLKTVRMREKKESLWNSTCFELFLKSKHSTRYVEWNFAPSGDWWFMDFSDYRERLGKVSLIPHSIEWTQSSVLECQVSLPLHLRAPLEIGVSCIVESHSQKTHWALTHLREKPDFHNSESFLISV
jgi:hypothetical protein